MRRTRDDRGATIVEFAFVMPVLALLLAALADLGFVVLGSSVASGAARDGARVGIIKYLDADDLSSANHDLIQDAVEAKLVGWIKPGTGPFVTARCLDGDNLATVKPCDDDIEIDTDVIEVTVSWEALEATGLLPVDRTQTDTARMVIIGENEGSGGAPSPGSTIVFSSATYTTTETDLPSTVTLTVTRTNTTGAASVNVATGPGSAGDPGDFTGVTTTVNFADGESSKDFTVDIVGDDASEGPETFTAVLSNPIGGALGGTTTATVTIEDDDGTAVPVLTSLQMRDANANGKVDQVLASFSTVLGSCNATSAWTLVSAPSGASLASVAISGMTATLTLTEGAGAHDTSVGSFTLALSDAVAGICDSSGTQRASFPATAPSDFANPVLLDFTETDGATNGRFEAGDVLELMFSEPLQPTVIPASNVSVAASPSDRFTAPGVTNGAVVLAPGDYIGNNKTATFGSSTVSYASGNTRVRLVLGTCSGDCGHLNTESGAEAVAMSAAPTITDVAGRGAVGTVTKTLRMF